MRLDAGDYRRSDDAGARPQMRRQAAGHAEADDSRATAHQRTRFRDRRRELGRQVAAVPAANDMHPGSGSDARFKCQSDDDNHVAPASPFSDAAKTSRDPAGSFFADRLARQMNGAALSDQPLVTTGGGALPLPVCAQPAMLSNARITAVPSAIFFMGAPILDGMEMQDRNSWPPPLVQKRHSSHLIERSEPAPRTAMRENHYTAGP